MPTGSKTDIGNASVLLKFLQISGLNSYKS